MMQLWNARDNSAMFEVEHILKSEFKCIFSKAKQQQCVIRRGRISPFVLPHYSHYLRYTLHFVRHEPDKDEDDGDLMTMIEQSRLAKQFTCTVYIVQADTSATFWFASHKPGEWSIIPDEDKLDGHLIKMPRLHFVNDKILVCQPDIEATWVGKVRR